MPEIEFLREFVGNCPAAPPQVIDGILHKGCKMILGGTSKSNKSWCLLDLAISVASGQWNALTGPLRCHPRDVHPERKIPEDSRLRRG